MNNPSIERGRMFLGALLLAAAAISWFTGFTMSPHGTVNGGSTHEVRSTVVLFVRHSAIGNLILSAIAGWLLFPPSRRRMPARDYAVLTVIAVIVLTSLYQLVWLRSFVTD